MHVELAQARYVMKGWGTWDVWRKRTSTKGGYSSFHADRDENWELARSACLSYWVCGKQRRIHTQYAHPTGRDSNKTTLI
jgi:hypothetical protein